VKFLFFCFLLLHVRNHFLHTYNSFLRWYRVWKSKKENFFRYPPPMGPLELQVRVGRTCAPPPSNQGKIVPKRPKFQDFLFFILPFFLVHVCYHFLHTKNSFLGWKGGSKSQNIFFSLYCTSWVKVLRQVGVGRPYVGHPPLTSKTRGNRPQKGQIWKIFFYFACFAPIHIQSFSTHKWEFFTLKKGLKA